MRKLLSVLLSISLVLSSVVMLSTVVGAESKFKITEDAGIKAQLQDFKDIKALFTATPVLADIKAFYVTKFQTNVKAIDAPTKAEDPKIDESISLVLDNAIKGTLNAAQAKQAVDKGLQWYFYFSLKDLVIKKVKPALESGDKATAKANFDKAIQIYEGALQATAQKRDDKFKTTMRDALDNVIIPLIQADIESGNVLDFNVHRQMLDKTLIKLFTLATLTYAESIPTKPAADQPAAFTEGYFFYMPVYAYLKGGSPADANYVKDAFGSGDASKIDFVKIQAAIQRALIGKVSEYVLKSFTKLEANDLQGARGYSYEGIMFVAAQETFLGAKYAEVQKLALLYQNAVDYSELENAKKYGFQMLKFLVISDGIHLTIGSKTLNVNGVEKTFDVASYLNTETNRTLVPTRAIAEALQAEVTYVEATQTVKVVKDGKTLELIVGSDKVTQDGVVNLKFKLDQPVLIKDNRSFIPLRAVAELFGKKVFYDQGEVIILR